MNKETRAVVAFLAGSHIFGNIAHSIYDVAADERYDAFTLMDERGLHLAESNQPRAEARTAVESSYLYLSSDGSLFLNIIGNSFKGYDSFSSCLFAGKASSNLIVLYDRRIKSFFKFRICSADFINRTRMICGQVCNDCVVGRIE